MILNTYYINDNTFINGATMNSITSKYSVVNTEYYINFVAPELANSNRMLMLIYLGLKRMYGIEDYALEGKLMSLPFQEEMKLSAIIETPIISSTLYREVQIPAGVVNVSLRHFKTTLEVSYDASKNSNTNI